MIAEPILFKLRIKIPYKNYTDSRLLYKITLSSKKVVYEAVNNDGEVFFLGDDLDVFDKQELRKYWNCNYAENNIGDEQIKYIKKSYEK